MGPVQKSVVTLRISGDDLDPVEVSDRLGCRPISSQRKDDVIVNPRTGTERTARTGLWHLESSDRSPVDLDGQVEELLSRMTRDLAVWEELTEIYYIDLFCGLFLGSSNEGVHLYPDSLVALGHRACVGHLRASLRSCLSDRLSSGVGPVHAYCTRKGDLPGVCRRKTPTSLMTGHFPSSPSPKTDPKTIEASLRFKF